jgi:uncharacterized cofD-like protein
MNPRLRGLLRWLTPGMAVKRWILLSVFSMGILVVALLYAVGTDLVRWVYRALPAAGPERYAIMVIVFVLGAAGFALALVRLVRSVARSVSSDPRLKPSTMIYRARRLERGPRVVALGGGTGLSTVLRGLKEETSNLTAIVTLTDDGGSSGRLREEVDVLPPGDVRNCILALAEDETKLSDFFQYRFVAPEELRGHSLGNLVLAGLEQATGGFDSAVAAMSQFLNIRGRVLPSTLTKTHLIGTMEDGAHVEGETNLATDPRRILRIDLAASPVAAHDEVLTAVAEADLILVGPGSLFTSIVPNLLVEGIAAAIERASAEKVLVANLMTQPGETVGFTLCDHLQVLADYIDLRRFDAVLVNAAEADASLVAGYRDEEAVPVEDDLSTPNPYGLTVLRADLVGTAQWAGKETIKHDPKKLARALVRETRAFSASRRERAGSINP